MFLILMTLFTSAAWSHGGSHAPPSQQAEQGHELSPAEAQMKQLVDQVVNDHGINVGIQSISLKESSKTLFQINGSASSNAQVASLIEALNAETKTSQVYLVSSGKGIVDGQLRQIFVMTAAYTAR